jgi:hypothetical protein
MDTHLREQIRAKWHAAARARQIARQLTSEDDRKKVLDFALDLEAQAQALEDSEKQRPH